MFFLGNKKLAIWEGMKGGKGTRLTGNILLTATDISRSLNSLKEVFANVDGFVLFEAAFEATLLGNHSIKTKV